MLDPDRPSRGKRPDPPSDELVLAALQRAAVHRGRDTRAVPIWEIFEHLDVSMRSTGARHVRVRLDVMHAAGWIALSRHHGTQTWELTRAGERQLRTERRAGRVAQLPESPQHRAWRDAQRTAALEIDRFRRELRVGLSAAADLLDADPPASSDAVFQLGERMQRACWRLASASYCLREWVEPDDAHADLDTHVDPLDARFAAEEQARRRTRRVGRRNLRLWEDRGDER
jgi:hypothetical protein